MSLRVLVIPEDPVQNGYILKPLIEMVLAAAGKPAARVKVLSRPRLRGYDDAVQAVKSDIVPLYGHTDLWLFLPDRDRAAPDAMRALEARLAGQNVTLLCCPAEPEVEIYACVAHRREIGLDWADVRCHSRLKEDVFGPLLRAHGNPRSPGRGRETMTLASIRRRPSFFRLCPEMADLRDRIAALPNPTA